MTRQMALQTRGLDVGYGRRCVVGNVTLDLVPGEVLCLVGPNGSGKSTLLKTIAGQIAPLGGGVLLDGRDASSFKADELARNLSVMLTGRMACEMLSCLDVVETGRIPYTNALGTLREADREAVRGAMQAVGAWELRERDFMQISDGQRQRVLLARAIAQDAPVMALDEPTSYLDIRHQLELLACVRDLARTRGWTCLLSLHELALAQKVADRVACVCEGGIYAQGTPEDVLDAPTVAHVFDLGRAAWSATLGCVEDAPLERAARVFVLGGAGTAAASMRALRREGVGFCAGVLPENDVDCVLAHRLTTHVVSTPAFTVPDDETMARTREALAGCEALMDCLGSMDAGPLEACRREMLACARAAGLPVYGGAAQYLEALRNQKAREDAGRKACICCDATAAQAEAVRP